MTICLPPGVSLGGIPAGGVLVDSDWHGDDDGAWEPVSFARKAVNGKIRISVADLVKLGGPEGYIHGYICVRPPCGSRYREAVHNKANGKILDADGNRVGQQLKKNEGDNGYRARHFDDHGHTDLAAQYSTRADSAKAVVLYHNASKLHDEASDTDIKDQLASAKASLAAGDADSAAMFLAAAEARANVLGDNRLESHIRDTRAAVVDGPKAISPPDMAGLRFESKKPVPGLPAKHAPLPSDIRHDVNAHFTAFNFARHNQRVEDKVASARAAVDAGDGDAAMKHLAGAYDAAFEAGDQNAIEHVAAAHDLIAAHFGAEMLNRHGLPEAHGEATTDHGAGPVPRVPRHGVPPVKLPAGEEPGTPKVPEPRGPEAPAEPKPRKLPKAKAAAIDEELHAAQIGTGIEYSRAHDIIVDARADIADGRLEDARTRMADAHLALAGNPIAAPARDHIAMADEQLAAHLKVKPLQLRTITHTDEHAGPVSRGASNLMAADLRIANTGRLGYLGSKNEVAAKLRAGDAGQVIRDLRELDARASEQRGYEWNPDRKKQIALAQKGAADIRRELEARHKLDLADQSLHDRTAQLARDMLPADRSWRPAAPPLQRATGHLASGNLRDAVKELEEARDAAASQPRTSQARQFEKDIDALHHDVNNAYLAQQAAALATAEPETVTAAGLLGGIQRERNQVRASLASSIGSGVKVKKAPSVRGALGETSIVTFNDGSRWVHKRPISGNEAESDKEELASIVARAMGVRAPAVVRDPLDHKSVYMTLVNGKTAVETGDTAGSIMRNGTPEAADMMRRIGLMDYLIKNSDRHGGNFMIDQDGMPNGIDHGNAWSGWSSGSRVTELVHYGDFTPAYYAQVKKNLAAIEPEFTKIAGQNYQYYQTMMKQLDMWMNGAQL